MPAAERRAPAKKEVPMKKSKRLLKRAASALLVLLLLVALAPEGAWASLDYEEITSDGYYSVYYECPYCGFDIKLGAFDRDVDPSELEDYFCDDCGLCWDCAREHAHCEDCDK